MQKIGPCLLFDGQAEQAENFYIGIFKNARILDIKRYGEGAQRPAGTVLIVRFVLDGEEFVALNGGPEFSFSPAISFVVNCENQQEVDSMWETLLDGGHEVECGWLTDRFGLSWQIVPKALYALLDSDDSAASQRAFAAMLKMKKLDIAALEQAYKQA